tara:strand:- start:9985 stop:15777 length:5793 start_codon:yes stop_codon:yes gene_type:complete
MSEEINPLTQLPYDGDATIDATSGTAVEINPLTKQAYAPTTSYESRRNQGALSTIYQDDRDIDRFRKYNVPRGQLLDWEEIRALNQSTVDKWGNGLAKMGVTAVGAAAENTLGILFGIGEMAFGSGVYYDNAIGKAVDNTNAWMQENMPNYYTREEQNMSTFSKLGTANFWADTVANGLGYSLGSIAAMYLTGGKGIVGLGAKGIQTLSKGKQAKALYDSTKAVINGTKLSKQLSKGASKLSSFKRGAQLADAGLMMSLGEASVEARQNLNDTRETLLAIHMEREGITDPADVSAEDRKEIERIAIASGNTHFLAQLPVLMGTNLLMFGKQVSGFRAAQRASKDVVFDAAARKATSKYANDGFWKGTARRLAPAAKNAAEEAFQEGFQFASGVFASNYHTAKYKNNGVGDMMAALNESLSETFGSQEGLEAILVGALTGKIMGAGQSVISKEVSTRKANAQKLADFINAGLLDNVQNSMINSSAMSDAMKRMQAALERNDHKAFKDAQFDLISYNALYALETGGFELFKEKLEDSKNLSDEEFAKQFNITDKNGDPLDIVKATGKTKAKTIEDLQKKLDNFEKIYNNVSDRFALPNKTSGLPRALMSEEQRKAEDKTYENRARLRNQLILSGAALKDRNERMGKIQDNMAEIIANSLAGIGATSRDKLNIDKILNEFSIFQTEPGEADAKDYDPEARFQKLRNNLLTAIAEISKIDPVAAQALTEQAKDYVALAKETIEGLDSYNKLASDPFAQAEFQRQTEAQEKATQARERAKMLKEKTDKAETSDEMDEALKDTTDAESRPHLSKRIELVAKENSLKKEFIAKAQGTTRKEKIEDLEKKDKTKLSAIQKKALNLAIGELKRQDQSQQVDNVEVKPVDNSEDNLAQEDQGTQNVEEEFNPDNVGQIESISEDGRTFQINGENFYNRFDNPLDAIQRDGATDEIYGVVLEDEDGNTHVIQGPESRVDALAYGIIMSELYKMEGQPTIEKPIVEAIRKAIADKTAKLAKTGVHGKKNDVTLRYEIYKLRRLQEALLENRDILRTLMIQEGATKADLKNDPDLKAMSKQNRSLAKQISDRKRVLRARGKSIGLKSNEYVMVEGQAIDAIKDTQQLIQDTENDITRLEKDIEQLTQDKERYIAGRDTESAEAASRDLQTAKQELEDRKKDLAEGKAILELEKNNLKRLQNEEEGRIPRDAEQVTEGSTGEAKRKVDEGEDSNRAEAVEKKRPPINVTPESERLTALEETLSDGDKRILALFREKGKSEEMINTFIRNKAKQNGQGNTLTSQYKAEDIIANPEKYSEAVVVNAYRHLKGEGGPIDSGSAESRTRRILEEVKKDIAEGLSINSSSYYTGLKRGIREAYEMMLKDMSDPVVEEDTVEPRDVDEKSIEKAMQDKQAVNKSKTPASPAAPGVPLKNDEVVVDRVQLMPPPEGPTLGESLKQKTSAGVPPTQGDNLPMKSAMDDPTIGRGDTKIRVNEEGIPFDNTDELEQRVGLRSLRVGDQVEFVIVENDFFVENHKGKDTELEYLPIYYQKNGVILGKLQRSTSQEKAEIVRKLRAGERVTTTVSEVFAPNYNNARVSTPDGTVKYFYDPRESLGEQPVLVFSVIDEDIQQLVAPQSPDVNLSSIETSKIGEGQVAFLIPNSEVPGGQTTVSVGSTASLSPAAVDTTVDLISKGDLEGAAEVVASSSEVNRAGSATKRSHLEFLEFKTEEQVIDKVDLTTGQKVAPTSTDNKSIVYYSPAANRLVKISNNNFKKAMANQPFKMSFVEVVDDQYKTKGAPDAEYNKVKDNFEKDFREFLGNKKYQVSRNRMEAGNAPYTSRVTGNRYDRYTDYLFSTEEGAIREQGALGHNSILATDLVRTAGGLFHNPVVSFAKEDIFGKSAEQIAENVTFASSTESTGKTFKDKMASPFRGDTAREDFDNDCKL